MKKLKKVKTAIALLHELDRIERAASGRAKVRIVLRDDIAGADPLGRPISSIRAIDDHVIIALGSPRDHGMDCEDALAAALEACAAAGRAYRQPLGVWLAASDVRQVAVRVNYAAESSNTWACGYGAAD